MRALVVVLLLLIITRVTAQNPHPYAFEVLPASPIAGQPFQLRVTVPALECLTLPNATVVTPLAGNIVQYELHMTDACFPNPAQERTYDVPSLFAGVYTFRLATCIHYLPPLPNEQCYTAIEHSVTVRASGMGASDLPFVSPSASWFLMCAVLLFGFAAMRRS